MARFWRASCTVTVKSTDHRGHVWESTRQVPTFVIDTDIRGERDADSVERSARSVIMTADNLGHIVGTSVSVAPITL